jgi:Asp-tRNA(Asn)/Glu-tRNA(Gln) amidotransferase A subunit family amidase
MSDPYSDLDATSQAELIRRKEASPRELVDAAISRIEKLNPKINAVIIPLFDWWADGHDLLVTPTISEPPPVLGDLGGPSGEPRKKWLRNLEVIPFTPAFNVTGQPGISLPLHWTGEDLPLGVHLVSAYAR